VSRTGPPFAEFYADYLSHHRHPLNRALHLLAKLLAAASLLGALRAGSILLLLAAPVLAVAPCWLGHLAFEGNSPVSWERPSASLLGTLAGLAGRLRRLLEPVWTGRRQALPPPPPSAGRPYYSFLADLRMCAEMILPRRTGAAVAGSATAGAAAAAAAAAPAIPAPASSPRDTSEPT
jgi:hypothetical protein